MALVSLVLFVRIEAFEWVTANPNRKFFPAVHYVSNVSPSIPSSPPRAPASMRAHRWFWGAPRQRGLEECSSWRPVSCRQSSGAFDNLLGRRNPTQEGVRKNAHLFYRTIGGVESTWEVYSADFRHRKEITVCSRSYPLDGSAPPGPPIAFVGANRRMHAIQAELFHEVTLTRHICLGVIHRVPHAPIAACCAGSRLCGPAQTFRWRSPAPARRAGRQAARAAPARLADLVRSSQGAGGAAGEREGRADRLARRQWGCLPGQGGRRSDANGVWPVGHSRRQRQYPTLGEDRSSQSAAMSLSVSAF